MKRILTIIYSVSLVTIFMDGVQGMRPTIGKSSSFGFKKAKLQEIYENSAKMYEQNLNTNKSLPQFPIISPEDDNGCVNQDHIDKGVEGAISEVDDNGCVNFDWFFQEEDSFNMVYEGPDLEDDSSVQGGEFFEGHVDHETTSPIGETTNIFNKLTETATSTGFVSNIVPDDRREKPEDRRKHLGIFSKSLEGIIALKDAYKRAIKEGKRGQQEIIDCVIKYLGKENCSGTGEFIRHYWGNFGKFFKETFGYFPELEGKSEMEYLTNKSIVKNMENKRYSSNEDVLIAGLYEESLNNNYRHDADRWNWVADQLEERFNIKGRTGIGIHGHWLVKYIRTGKDFPKHPLVS